MDRDEILETTLGDLIAALIEATSQFIHDEKEAYKVVAFALTHLLYNSGATSRAVQIWH